MPLDLSKASCLSMFFNISFNNLDVMLPFSEQQQKVGICLPSNSHSGPRGYHFPLPVFFSISLSCTAHGQKGSRPITHVRSKSFTAKIIVHITGSLEAAVKPRTVKWLSLVTEQICSHSSVGTRNFSPPQCPSFA